MFTDTSGNERVTGFRASLGGTLLEIDYDATKRVYPYSNCYDWCQCAGCTNFSAAKHRFFPKHIAAVVTSFGVDPHEPIHLTGVPGSKKIYGWNRYAGNYVVIGRILDGHRSARYYDPDTAQSFLWATQTLPSKNWCDFIWRDKEQLPPFFLLKFSILMPWLPEYIPLLEDDDVESVLMIGHTRRFRREFEAQVALCRNEGSNTEIVDPGLRRP